MGGTGMLEIKTADELVDPELEARWTLRRVARQGGVLQQVLQVFVERGGPVPVEEIAAAFPHTAPDTVFDALGKLDEEDLIQIRNGRIEVAYPLAAAPTSFLVRLADGQERHACCAIDALGLAPMLGGPVRVASRCHHCGSPLEFSVSPEGPGAEARDVMVWVGKRCESEARITTAL